MLLCVLADYVRLPEVVHVTIIVTALRCFQHSHGAPHPFRAPTAASPSAPAMGRRPRTNVAAGANAGAAADLMDDLPALVEAPESPPDSPRDGSAPASPGAVAAPIAPRQPPAAAHRNPRAAPARRVAAGPRRAESAPEPGSPPALVDGAPGSTTAAQAEEQAEHRAAEQAEHGAAERAGLALMNPRRRLLKDIYPAWADPRTFASREELKAKTGYALQVRAVCGFLRLRRPSSATLIAPCSELSTQCSDLVPHLSNTVCTTTAIVLRFTSAPAVYGVTMLCKLATS